MALAEAEATVASLQTRVAEYEARQARLKDSAKLVPQIEAEYSQLNRDYDIMKKNYETLVARRESAELSGEMEATGSVADFRLIDPPRASPQPVAPNRLLLREMKPWPFECHVSLRRSDRKTLRYDAVLEHGIQLLEFFTYIDFQAP